MHDPKSTAPNSQLEVHIDDQMAMGRYSNFMLVNHNENEFVIDFAYVSPGPARARVVSRVIVGPKHMKRVVQTLTKNLEKYEARFGEIQPLDEGGETLLH